jgi:hypothetical protein
VIRQVNQIEAIAWESQIVCSDEGTAPQLSPDRHVTADCHPLARDDRFDRMQFLAKA